MTIARRLAVSLPALLLAGPAAAHHPLGGAVPTTAWHGLASGLAHPLIGLDHLAFLLAVGLVAGLARWGVLRPLSFVLAALLGVVTAWLGVWLTAVEWLVLATLLLAGLLLMRALPEWGWRVLLPVAGFLHGQAYAEAMIGAEATPVLAYLVGLALVQALLVLAVAALVRQVPDLRHAAVPRVAGIAVLAVGVLGAIAQL